MAKKLGTSHFTEQEDKMKRSGARSRDELTEIISTGADPQTHTTRAVEITIWEDQKERRIVGRYCTDEGVKPDAIMEEGDFRKNCRALRSLTKKLLEDGEPFVTRHGSDDLLHELRWTVED